MATMARAGMQKKMVVAAVGVPEECIRNAQVMIVTGETWHLIAPGSLRVHGLSKDMPVPVVGCPVWDVSGVKDLDRMRAIMDACVTPAAGVFNMAGLTTGLEALGGKRVVVEPLSVSSKQLEKSSRSLKVSSSRYQRRGSKVGSRKVRVQ